MKTLPETMPKYTIIKSDAEPFDVVCEELPGWLIVPRVGEHLIFGSYESPSGLLLDTEELKAENEVEIHGVRGVRISRLIKSYDLSELCRKGDHEERWRERPHAARSEPSSVTDQQLHRKES